MPSRKFYKRCTKDELVSFAQARGVQVEHPWDAARPPRKADYRDALRRADRHPATFRFLSLPPEARNSIYKELLIIHHDKSSCSPQILAACSEIRDEATSLLYVDNLIYVQFDGEDVHVGRRHCGTLELGLVRCTWPEFLRRIGWIEIRIHGMEYHHTPYLPFGSLNYQHQPGTQRRVDELLLNQALYSLCTFLHKGHKLRSLHINVLQTTHRYDMREPSRVFYPLRLLGGIPQCRITGLGDAAASTASTFVFVKPRVKPCVNPRVNPRVNSRVKPSNEPRPALYPDVPDREFIRQLDICRNLYFEVAREVPRRANITIDRVTRSMYIPLRNTVDHLQLPAPDFVIERFHLGRIPFYQRFFDRSWELHMRSTGAQMRADLSGLDLVYIQQQVVRYRITPRGLRALHALRLAIASLPQ